MSTPHIEDDLLDRYAIGKTPQASLAGLEEHLLECPLCQSRLVETDEMVSLFQKIAVDFEPAAVPAWKSIFRAPRFAWAGAAVAAILVFSFVIGHRAPRPAPATVIMQSLRGPETGAHIAAQRPSRLVFDLAVPDIPAAFEVEVVDIGGNEILNTRGELLNGRIWASVKGLSTGSYWVRVYRKQTDRELIAEYALVAK